MKTFTRALSTTLLAAACSGTADETVFTEPVRYDGSVEDDGIFLGEEHRDSYCSQNPDSRWCSELGTAKQPWVSAEYHGLTSPNASCWSSNSANGDCWFPALKQMKIQFDVSRCYDTPSTGLNDKATTAAVNAMVEAWHDGAEEWNGVGHGVTVERGTCSWPSGCVTVTMRCKEISGPVFAQARLTGPAQTRVSNLPAVNGEDQARALVYMSGEIDFDPHMLWFHLKNCNNQVNPTISQIEKLALNTGTHEMGHIFGFGHAGGNNRAIMFPNPAPDECDPEKGIWTSHADALDIFNTSSLGGTNILDENLDLLGPQ